MALCRFGLLVALPPPVRIWSALFSAFCPLLPHGLHRVAMLYSADFTRPKAVALLFWNLMLAHQ
jgi:hypothetical protein